MKTFAALFRALDETTATTARLAALESYFRSAPDADRVWTVALLSGRRPRRAATTTELRQWAAEAAGVPDWLFGESYALAGDLAETIALILPPGQPSATSTGLADTLAALSRLAGQPTEARRAFVEAAWASLSTGRYVCSRTDHQLSGMELHAYRFDRCLIERPLHPSAAPSPSTSLPAGR